MLDDAGERGAGRTIAVAARGGLGGGGQGGGVVAGRVQEAACGASPGPGCAEAEDGRDGAGKGPRWHE